MCTIDNIKKVANYLNVTPGEIFYNNQNVVARKINNTLICGYVSIVNALAKESNSNVVKNSFKTPEITVQVQQWLDYAVIYIANGYKDKHVVHHILNELNNYLLIRSYFVDHLLTLADLAIFYIIHNLMKSLSPIEKENYINLSRWYDHLQQDEKIRQDIEVINLNAIYLHNWATGTHL